jgi:hypothetical protein
VTKSVSVSLYVDDVASAARTQQLNVGFTSIVGHETLKRHALITSFITVAGSTATMLIPFLRLASSVLLIGLALSAQAAQAQSLNVTQLQQQILQLSECPVRYHPSLLDVTYTTKL